MVSGKSVKQLVGNFTTTNRGKKCGHTGKILKKVCQWYKTMKI